MPVVLMSSETVSLAETSGIAVASVCGIIVLVSSATARRRDV